MSGMKHIDIIYRMNEQKTKFVCLRLMYRMSSWEFLL